MLESLSIAVAAVSLLAWIHLYAFRHGFWRCTERLPQPAPMSGEGPAVVAVVPARNEADVVGAAIASLLDQRIAPALQVVLVDDGSDDGTADAARAAAHACGGEARLAIVTAGPRPPGWTGKLWAMAQGIARAETMQPPARYLLLTDADIRHDRDGLRALVAKAESGRLDLVSQMVRLHCERPVERLLIPAFVFFFQKLYPFPAVNDPRSAVAGAAGGCMLVRLDALRRAGGIDAISDALIDDCALARLIKRNGPIWLGLTPSTVSLRPYGSLGAIWRMVARTAYTQLRHSPLLLAGTLLGMMALYLAGPLSVIGGIASGAWIVAALGAASWALMATCYRPTLRLYGLSPLWAAALPLAAALYTVMTLDSARRHWQGRGGEWKGRDRGGIGGMAAPVTSATDSAPGSGR